MVVSHIMVEESVKSEKRHLPVNSLHDCENFCIHVKSCLNKFNRLNKDVSAVLVKFFKLLMACLPNSSSPASNSRNVAVAAIPIYTCFNQGGCKIGR